MAGRDESGPDEQCTTDFLNIELLASAVASKINIDMAATKRLFDLDEAAAYCGLTRDEFAGHQFGYGAREDVSCED